METTLDDPIPSPIKKRHPFLASAASLVIPGLGQLYNGQPKKAFLFFALTVANPFLLGLFKLPTYFYGLILVLVVQFSLYIYILRDAFVQAKRQADYIPKSYNHALYYLLYAATIMAFNWNFGASKLLGIQTLRISSPSSCPTLQASDCTVADMNSYNDTPIAYGDLVVFTSEEKNVLGDPIIWTFRVVGLPNDKLALKDNVVVINGKECPSHFIKDTLSEEFPVSEFTEEFPNGLSHQLYKFKQSFDSSKTTMQEITVPADSYFVLGDNRDNALDSRYKGCVKREDILGRMIYTYWGKTKDRINIDLRNK